MILYIENPKDTTRKLLEQDIKLTHRNPLYSYTLTMRKQKDKLRKQFHSPSQWRIKYLGINLPKETKCLYIENYKTLWKKSKMTQIDGEIYHVHGSEESK